MLDICRILQEEQQYKDIAAAFAARRPLQVTGAPPLLQAMLVATLFAEGNEPLLLVAQNEDDAARLYRQLQALLGESAAAFPAMELLPFEVHARNLELVSSRVKVLSRLAKGEKLLVVCSIAALSRRLTPPVVFAAHQLTLQAGSIIQPAELALRLTQMGYTNVPLTEVPGDFSRRGSIIDVFPIDAEKPLRIDFFDDEVDTIRRFDPATQRSLSPEAKAKLMPAHELPLSAEARSNAGAALEQELARLLQGLKGPAKKQAMDGFTALREQVEQGMWESSMEMLQCLFYPQSESLLAYFPKSSRVVLSEAELLMAEAKEMADERRDLYADLLDAGRLLPSFYDNFRSDEQLRTMLAERNPLLISQLLAGTGGFAVDAEFRLPGRELPAYSSKEGDFDADMQRFMHGHYRIFLTASSAPRLKRIEELLLEAGAPSAHICQTALTQGFESVELRLAVITEKELFAAEEKKKRRKFKGGERIENFLDLKVGDYVVHVHQGIARFVGVERMTVGDIQRDYLILQYAGTDRLFVPVDQLDLIQKYVGDDSSAPKLYKLGGNEWNKVKAKVRGSVRDMAKELLAIYAAREQVQGFAYSADSVWQQEFEDAFPFEETDDQLRAIEEIKTDMESSRVMDRLLCGDVGYGKTEVALRAAFKAAMDGKQVAILVPTTVLAQQHYNTVCERFAQYPVKSAQLSRFVQPGEQRRVLRELAAGRIDVVVGTHRLLSKDVQFKDLGLLIIDEEQRFGVAHKEKIKQLRNNVDVLTLSATPIPRTLHMSLVGMRDMSMINTAPLERRPVQTYVVEANPRLLKDAITRELDRGGQVYVVHNRVMDIYALKEQLEALVPQARIGVGHGQMAEKELEQVMMDFVKGEIDVLLCTTIIESGLDIPNANTMIVDEADNYGLAQLYQLRGRVGRSTRQAYAYFTYRHNHIINEMARKRLLAIRDFTELGAGFKIAMRDLELRGAGNILGAEQHGHIAAVGFALYCRLLQEEIALGKGEHIRSVDELNPQLELQVNAFIPDAYVEDSALKIEIYKRIAAAGEPADVDAIAAELQDRYGAPPLSVTLLLQVGRIKSLARKARVAQLQQKGEVLEMRFAAEHSLTPEVLLYLASRWGKRVTFSDKKGFALLLKNGSTHDQSGRLQVALELLQDLLSRLN